jgi:rhodanese-related sulfurtransferase
MKNMGSVMGRGKGIKKSIDISLKMKLFMLGFFLFGICFPRAWAEEFPHVSFEALTRLIQEKDREIVVVDTQPAPAYEMGHIKGAINLPWSLDLKSPQDLPYDKTLILYCDCPAEEDATDVARQLREKWAYERIKILKGSWSRWKESGLPIEQKEKGRR